MAEQDPAASWFMAMQAMRLIGLGQVLAGAMGVAGTLDLPRLTGAVLMVVGLATFFFAPWVMAKAWKNRRK